MYACFEKELLCYATGHCFALSIAYLATYLFCFVFIQNLCSVIVLSPSIQLLCNSRTTWPCKKGNNVVEAWVHNMKDQTLSFLNKKWMKQVCKSNLLLIIAYSHLIAFVCYQFCNSVDNYTSSFHQPVLIPFFVAKLKLTKHRKM